MVSQIRKNKENTVSKILEDLKNSSAVFLLDLKGMNVKESVELRDRIRETSSKLRIVKNTLLGIALDQINKKSLVEDLLFGPTAVLFVQGDISAAAKVLKASLKEFEKGTIKGGFIENKTLSAIEIEALADIPPKEVLLSKVLYLLQSPLSRFAGVLGAVPRDFIYAMQALKDKKEAS
ncbi:LSU ribosomal protein L10P [Thermodesulfobium acidiphilum]|uniref:Large ribosomal subunit protein uL10 n=1 Tax=Thermodesulfobium acidiphilum TaxID=1794699 RepID=A0A2R4VZC2_THEAF|nr:50S ribosomal protein L10 [Thermodesulfobium acidiphilum]AWB09899.1 LSU ribosomal protein L10P [Thermodesulfobium acidiphilum]